MNIFTQAQLIGLLSNGAPENRDKDHVPVVKLFMTNTACTWLLSEIDPEDHDIAFGLCDLGMGYPELGYVSLRELKDATNPHKLLFLEQDDDFIGKYPMSVYAAAARSQQGITTDDEILRRYRP